MNKRERSIKFLTRTARAIAGTVPNCVSPGIMAMMNFNKMATKPDKAKLGKLRGIFIKSATEDFGQSVGDCFNLVAAAYFIEGGRPEIAKYLLLALGDHSRPWVPSYVWDCVAEPGEGGGGVTKKAKPRRKHRLR